MLKQRVLTALCLLPLALTVIFYLPLPAFVASIAIIIALAGREWGAFVNSERPAMKLLYGAITAVLLAILLLAIPPELFWSEQGLNPLAHGVLIAGGIWWLFGLFLILGYPNRAAFWQGSHAMKAIFGQLTLVPCFVAILVLKSWPDQQGAYLLLSVLLLVWGADTGAYFVGKAIGKNKLIPKVSPGKTREGLLGGMAVCALLGVFGAYFLPTIGLVQALVLAMATGLASALGDLTESMFKRSADIKDSGRMLPGHGGVLDRIDSITAAMPVFALLYLYLGS